MAKKAFTSDRIVLKGARLAFCDSLYEAKYFGAVPQVNEKKKFRVNLLLDPSSKEHAATIAQIKSEAKKVATQEFPDGIPKSLELCYGNGNDLDKVYDGFADMFYIKVSNDARPLVGNRQGGVVTQGDPQAPYAGCVVNAKITLWCQNSHGRKGVNGNLLTVQFVRAGDAFGRPALNPDEEFEALEDEVGATAPAATVDADDPFA